MEATKMTSLDVLKDTEQLVLNGQALGPLHAVELAFALQTSIATFHSNKATRLSEKWLRVDGAFPELYLFPDVRATFWIGDLDMGESIANQRHFVLKIEFGQTIKKLLQVLTGQNDISDRFAMEANTDHSIEGKRNNHALAPDLDSVLSDIYYASQDIAGFGEIPEFTSDYEVPRGLSCKLEVDLLLQELFSGFSLPNKSIAAIFNLQPMVGRPRYQFLFNLHDHFAEEERGHASEDIQLKFDQFVFRFSHKNEAFTLENFWIKGHIECGFHPGEMLTFQGGLNLKEKSLAVDIVDFPSTSEILGLFLPKKDPLLKMLHDSGLGGVAIEHLGFKLLLERMHIAKAEIAVSSASPICLPSAANPLVKLTPHIQLAVSDPLTSYHEVSFEVLGIAEVAGTSLSAFYNSSQHLLLLELNIGTGPDTAQIIEALPGIEEGIPQPSGDLGEEENELSISDIRLVAQKSEKWNFDFHLDVQTDWQIDIAGQKFWFRDLFLDLSYAEGHVNNFDASCRFSLGGFDLSANAAYSSDFGWTLMAESAPFALDIGSLLNHLQLPSLNHIGHEGAQQLADHFKLSLNIQRIFLHLLLPNKAVMLEHESVTREMEFLLHVAIEDNQDLPVPIDFFFLKIAWKKQLEWEAVLHLNIVPSRVDRVTGVEIAATSLVLESKKEGDDLSFHGRLENLHISELIAFFKERFGVDHEVHSALEDVVLNKLDISLTKTEKDWKFRFECDTQIIIDETPEGKEDRGVDLQLIFEVNKTVDEESHESEYAVEFDARALLHLEDEQELEFDVKLHGEKDNTWMLASYSGEANIPVSELLQRWLHLEGALPKLSVDITEACLLIQSLGRGDERKRRLLVGVELNAQLELKELSFFKTFLPDGVTAGVKPLRVAYASADFDKEALSTVSDALGEHAPLPKSTEEQALGKGFHLSAQLELGEFSMPFTVGPEAAPHEPSGNSDDNKRLETGLLRADPAPSSAPAALTKWFKVNQDIGPMHIGRVGIQFEYEVQKLWILLDAGLELAVIEASVTGLGFGSALSEFHAEVQLAGLGIDFHKGALEIGGALIFQKPSSEYPDATSFSGMVTLQFGDLGLSVFGSYTDKLGDPSLLLYGILNYPIGGPPFFFVEGLAAGVGINQRIIYPTIDKLDEFSLISAVTHPDDTKTLAQRLSAFEQDIHAELGSYFFAAGVQFSTFNLIHSFVLMILGIGEQVELDLLGYSALTMPKPEPGAKKPIDPVAEARLMIHAAFRPDAGTLKVEARLDPDHSYILSRKCKLQGGFAFYAWFEAEHRDLEGGQPGDFVLTLGGYHPHFRAESYYPQVPRLGFHWQVDKHMLFKGEFYFALTPGALMLGGLLSGNWKMDHFEAGFHLGLNMLIQWQPFHYGADAELSIRAAYRDGLFQVELELSTKVEIWGPEFGGTAHLKILFLEVDVDFGEAKEAMPAKLDWIAFAAAFLSPVMEDNKTVAGAFSASIVRGLVSKAERGEYYIGLADPSNPELLIESQVPFIIGKLNAKPEPLKSSNQEKVNEKLGIAPMDRAAIASELKIVVTHENQEVDYFQFESVLKNAPAALWGPSVETKLNDNATVDNCQFGYRLTLKKALSHPSSGSIAKALSDLNPIPFPGDVDRIDIAPLPLEWLTDKNAELEHNYDSDATRDFLEAFGLKAESNIGQQEFEAVERMNAFQPNALSTHE